VRDDAIRLGDIHLDMLDGAVAGKDDSTHRCHDVPSDRWRMLAAIEDAHLSIVLARTIL
jgi:hypothetical protein